MTVAMVRRTGRKMNDKKLQNMIKTELAWYKVQEQCRVLATTFVDASSVLRNVALGFLEFATAVRDLDIEFDDDSNGEE